jgi:hypothetical protein
VHQVAEAAPVLHELVDLLLDLLDLLADLLAFRFPGCLGGGLRFERLADLPHRLRDALGDFAAELLHRLGLLLLLLADLADRLDEDLHALDGDTHPAADGESAT